MTISRDHEIEDGLTLRQAAIEEIERMRAQGDLDARVEPRCFVCCEVESREFVNALIAGGLTNREITDRCAKINARRKVNGDERTIDSKRIWHHRTNHFNLQLPAGAVWREIIERRAEEFNRDFINGVGHAITPYAVLETIMVKGMMAISHENSDPPTIKETIEASTKLHDLSARDAGQRKMADVMYKMDRIISAIFDVVPEEYHESILARVENRDPRQAIAEKVEETAQKAIKDFTPNMTVDEGDAL